MEELFFMVGSGRANLKLLPLSLYIHTHTHTRQIDKCFKNQKTETNGLYFLILLFCFVKVCHTLISSGDNHLQTFRFLPVELSCLTLIVAQSVKFRDISEGKEPKTQNGGELIYLWGCS